MPGRLAKHLSFISTEEQQALFGSITNILAYPPGDPIREGAIQG
jgi:hypothetical protein